jgi:hypothetical protein
VLANKVCALQGSDSQEGFGGMTLRALAILETLSTGVLDADMAAKLGDSLLPLLQAPGGRGGSAAARRAQSEVVSRTLSVLAALWARISEAATPSSGTLLTFLLAGFQAASHELFRQANGWRVRMMCVTVYGSMHKC